MRVTKQKATGAHFTPPELARFVAGRIAESLRGCKGSIRVLDPACGDGNLLCALSSVLPNRLQRRVTLIGIENDDASFESLRFRQGEFGDCTTDLIKADFLEFFDDGGLFLPQRGTAPVDVIVANPPYVRTQVLGAKRAQRLAERFGLSGRVDLYQAFLVAMARQLKSGGILGVITSNRFLTTKAGMATRRFLRTHFEINEIVDLGDTKIFEAAVLPALVFATKRHPIESTSADSEPQFIRIYESHDEAGEAERKSSVLDCIREARSGLFRTNGSSYRVTVGRLPIPEQDVRPWTMLTSRESEWIARIQGASQNRLGDVAKVRVGIKTTADSVFIKRDWESLPPDIRPEPKHLRALLSQEDAAKWRPLATNGRPRQVLYTHEVVDGQRRAIRFKVGSPTWRYLVKNRKKLESREYVLKAGRAWYEIWVPQDPMAWSSPKIVLPDISPDARFFLDTHGSIVDGNCYWITTNDPNDEDLLLLILGSANSALLSRYHDLVFQNKLYAKRRRHLTQYVAEYPLPDRRAPASQNVVEVVRRLVNSRLSRDEQHHLSNEVDRLVCQAFGVDLFDLTDISD